MIERVARAICDGHTNGNASFDDVPEQYQNSYRDAARAAIEEMREPTEAMVLEGGGPKNDWDVRHDVRINRAKVSTTYTTMIDAALKES